MKNLLYRALQSQCIYLLKWLKLSLCVGQRTMIIFGHWTMMVLDYVIYVSFPFACRSKR